MPRGPLIFLIFLSSVCIFRTLALAVASFLVSTKHPSKRLSCRYEGLISIVIPVDYREKGILKCISSLLEIDQELAREVVVVVDGASDSIIEQLSSQEEVFKRIRILAVEKSGKIRALNKGIEEARGDIVVLTDIDCLWTEGSLRKLTCHFNDSKTVAIGGHVFLSKTNGFLSKLQHIEFLNFFVYRMAASSWSGSTIAGGIGAFRKNLLKEVGLFKESLSEDFDNSLNILQHDLPITCEENAIIHTHGIPVTLMSMVRQRIRWYMGFCQVAKRNAINIFVKTMRFKSRLKCCWHLFNLHSFYFLIFCGYLYYGIYAIFFGHGSLLLTYWGAITGNLLLYLLFCKIKFGNKLTIPSFGHLVLYATVYFNFLLLLRMLSSILFTLNKNIDFHRDYDI